MTEGGWRGPILQHFGEADARAGRITVVNDPDGLLTEPGVIEVLTSRGFELVAFLDPVAFRYTYESRFRSIWDDGAQAHLVVVVRSAVGDVNIVPYDLLGEARASGRVLELSLANLFPMLDPSVLSELDPAQFDVLARAIDETKASGLGVNATRDFVLRHVFDVVPELIKQPVDLLRMLLRRHYRSLEIPRSIDDRLIAVLTENPSWQSWPLERIVSDRASFLTFLSERWPQFLFSKGLEPILGRETAAPSIPGPIDLPFDHDDIRVYIDNFFVEGLIEPTTAVDAPEDEYWYAVGIGGSSSSTAQARFNSLLEELEADLPHADTANYQDWQEFSLRWGTWTRLRWQTHFPQDATTEEQVETLSKRVQEEFSAWLLGHFGPLASHSPLPRPVVGHHIPHYLAHLFRQADVQRIALLVIDGMAIDQWRIVQSSFDNHVLDEHAIFSWIPTLTSVSRQAIFSGRAPFEFARSIGETGREAQQWSRFWQDNELPSTAIQYVDPQGKRESFQPVADEIIAAADHPAVRVVGAVIGTIDQSMHQAGLGTLGLHSLVNVWSQTRQLVRLVDSLLERGFAVFLTADHGNVHGRGMGKPNVGVTAQQRGERAHIFRSQELRRLTASKYPRAIEWPQIGLPNDYFPLLAPDGTCFLAEGVEAVSHGGIALEEVLVPFVRVSEGR